MCVKHVWRRGGDVFSVEADFNVEHLAVMSDGASDLERRFVSILRLIFNPAELCAVWKQ